MKKKNLILSIILVAIILVVAIYLVYKSRTGVAQVIYQNLTSCGTLSQSNTTYVLQNDISSTGNCLNMAASGIDVNLNGHTITYGTSRADCADDINCSGINKTNFAELHYVKIHDGTIRQADSGGDNNNGIGIANGLYDSEIYNLNIIVNGGDSMPIKIYWGGTGINIHHNNLTNNSTWVSNRHSKINASIYFERSHGYSEVHDNVIRGGPQAGIFISGNLEGQNNSSFGRNFNVYRNKIYHDQRYTNGFGIHLFVMTSGEIYGNTIGDATTQATGGGISAELTTSGGNVRIYSNTINTKSRPQSLNYGASVEYSPYWVYAIKIENSIGVRVYQNNIKVTANSSTGHAYGIAMDAPVGANYEISNNVSEAVTSTADKVAAPLYIVGVRDGSNTQIADNTFISNNHIFHMAGEGGSGITLRSNIFRKGTSPINYKTLYFANQVDSINNSFIDTKLENGASLQDIGIVYGYRVEFKVSWYLTIIAQNNTGAPITGVLVQANSALNNVQGTTGADGKAKLEIADYKQSRTLIVTNYNPYRITCTKSGYPTQSFDLNVTSSQTKTVIMGSGGGVGGVVLNKQADKTEVRSGDIVRYTITYTNGGTTVTDFYIQDSIPVNSTLVSGSITNWGVYSGGVIRWNLGTLSPNITGSVSFDVKKL